MDCCNTSRAPLQRACQHRPPVLNTTNFPHDQLAGGKKLLEKEDEEGRAPEQVPEQIHLTIQPNSTNVDSIGFANSVNRELEDFSLGENDLEKTHPTSPPASPPSGSKICLDRFEADEGPWAGLQSASGRVRHAELLKIFEKLGDMDADGGFIIPRASVFPNGRSANSSEPSSMLSSIELPPFNGIYHYQSMDIDDDDAMAMGQ
ncbi:hypothetical protein DFH27DRAFT_612635 [Peziza echinospora]|nr:hypothetical protein DFH27DRAFT_612635 [Peziza echinospora]